MGKLTLNCTAERLNGKKMAETEHPHDLLINR